MKDTIISNTQFDPAPWASENEILVCIKPGTMGMGDNTWFVGVGEERTITKKLEYGLLTNKGHVPYIFIKNSPDFDPNAKFRGCDAPSFKIKEGE